VLNDALRGKTWLVGERLTIADFSIAGLVPSAERMALPVEKFHESFAGTTDLQRCPRGGTLLLPETRQWPLGGPRLGLRSAQMTQLDPEGTFGNCPCMATVEQSGSSHWLMTERGQ
jgi:hypothetical protein